MQAADWIPTKERLPESGVEVLGWVLCRLMDSAPGVRVLVWDSEDECWLEDDAVEYAETDVTHWAPILSPYKS